MDSIGSYLWLSWSSNSLQVILMRYCHWPSISTFSSSTTSDSRVLAPNIWYNCLTSKHLLSIICSSPNWLFIILISIRSYLPFNKEIRLPVFFIWIISRYGRPIKLILTVFFMRQTYCVFPWSDVTIVIYSLKWIHLWSMLRLWIIVGVNDCLNFVKLFLRLNLSLILLLWLLWQTLILFHVFKLFLQILGD